MLQQLHNIFTYIKSDHGLCIIRRVNLLFQSIFVAKAFWDERRAKKELVKAVETVIQSQPSHHIATSTYIDITRPFT